MYYNITLQKHLSSAYFYNPLYQGDWLRFCSAMLFWVEKQEEVKLELEQPVVP